VLRYVGGSISPEMEFPKLLWLKRILPSTYRSQVISSTLRIIFRFVPPDRRRFDVHGRFANGIISPMNSAGSGAYFERIGLRRCCFGKLHQNRKGYRRARHRRWARALTKSAAGDFGLLEGTPVGASLIDAHAGGVGTIGGRQMSREPVDVCPPHCLHHGNLGCIIATTPEPSLRPGRVGSPYYSGMVLDSG